MKLLNTIRIIATATLLSTVLLNTAHSSVAATQEIIIMQPDGTSIPAIQRGDEWANWIETSNGYTIAQDSSGVWFYVSDFDPEGSPILSDLQANNNVPPGLSAGVKPDAALQMATPTSGPLQLDANGLLNSAGQGPFTGKLLFILAEFDDRQGTTSEAAWANMLNTNVRDYYKDVSYGDVNLLPASESFGTANNGVVGWVNIGATHPNTHSNTSTVNQVITRSAILAANPYVNFSAYDTNNNGVITSEELSIVVIVAGHERSYNTATPSVWGHAWCIWGSTGVPTVDGVSVAGCYGAGQNYAQFGELHGTHMATMGIIVHEIGHLTFGLPDLYDYDGSSRGIDFYGVMGGGSWGRAQGDTYVGQTPTHPTAWTKVKKGWVNAQPGTGVHSLVSATAGNANENNTVYRVNTTDPDQYFLVENRDESNGYDQGMHHFTGPNTEVCGIAVWHIDDGLTTNQYDNNRWVDLEEADNAPLWPYNTDMYSSTTSSLFNDSTVPNSRLKNGQATGMRISQLSACGDVMTVNFGNPVMCNSKPVTIMGTIGADTLTGTNLADVIHGWSANDSINGLAGNDTICAGGGNDTVLGGAGNDWINGLAGDDNIKGQQGNDIIVGGTGADTIRGSQGADIIYGGDGNDNIDGGWDDDTIRGDAGNDTILGNLGADIIYGGIGADTVDGGIGPDFVSGDDGNDVLKGGPDNDIVRGGTGNDNIRGSKGDDIIYGEDGIDVIDGGIGNDDIYGGNGPDQMLGSDGDDFLKGGPGNDILRGGNGADIIRGSKGNDVMAGDAGTDELVGGVGIDVMNGGTDVDLCTTDATDIVALCEIIN